jgi:hypothetical protein
MDESYNPIDDFINTPMGRKIIHSKLTAMQNDNYRLRRKIGDDRIAVFALNELSSILIKIMDKTYQMLNENKIGLDEESKKLVSDLSRFQRENFGPTMLNRVSEILHDTEGDDILLADLIGNQRPKIANQSHLKNEPKKPYNPDGWESLDWNQLHKDEDEDN